jgi:hypothetical protein
MDTDAHAPARFRYVDFSIAGSGLMGGMRLARHLRGTLGRNKIETLDAFCCDCN